MGILDALIEQNVKEPKTDVEYIYASDMAFPIYDKDDNRPSGLRSVFDEPREDPFVESKEDLDNLSYRPHTIMVRKYTLITDVIQIKGDDGFHRGYNFKIFGIRCHSNYPSVFWENTPENLIKIEKYKLEKEKLTQQEKKVHKLWDSIENLKIKYEN